MLAKKYIEQKIALLQQEFETLGFTVSELIVNDKRIITQLEKVDIGPFHFKRKPHFVSLKNYKKANIDPESYGVIWGIKLIKKK